MIQAIRNRLTGWVALVVIFFMAAPFVLLGTGDYFVGGRETYVALVNDQPITQIEFRDRWNNYREAMRQQLGENFDSRTFDQPLIRRQVLDDLLREEALVQAAAAGGMVVGDQRVREAIMADPTFQTDGRFDQLRYELLLQQARFAPTDYQERVRRALSVTQLTSPVATSSVTSQMQVDRYLALREQQRDFSYVRLDRPEADAEFVPDEAAVAAFYEENQSEFMSQEQVRLAYVSLLMDQVVTDTQPDERSLRQRFDEQAARFVTEERRQVSHILVEVAGDGDAEAHRAALEQAEALRARILGGEAFADVARETSQDLGSSRQGGELGWLTRGDTDPGFEDGVFSAEPEVVGPAVLSQAGYHLILVSAVEAEARKSFEEVREELVADLLESERERLYLELQERAINFIDSRPDDIDGLANAVGREVEFTEPFPRFGGPGIAGNREVQRQAFSDFLISGGTMSDLLAITPGHAVVIKVEEHIRSAPRPLDEVRDMIVERLRLADVEQRAKSQAEALEARMTAGETLEDLAASFEAEVVEASAVQRFGAAHPPRLVREVFKLPRVEADAPLQKLIEIGSAEYALVRLQAVRDGDPAAAGADALAEARRSLADAYAQAEAEALTDALFRAAKITVSEDRL